MNISSRAGTIGLVVAGIFLTSCAAVDTATRVYGNTRAVMTAKGAFDSAKGLKDAKPVFANITVAAVGSNLAPRDGQDLGQITAAFNASMGGMVQSAAREFGTNLAICPSGMACGGRMLSIQFIEEGNDANFVTKIAIGDKLKGRLVYTDRSTGQVLSDVPVNGVSSYAQVLEFVKTSVIAAMMKTYNKGIEDEAAKRIPAVHPSYENLLASA